MHRRRFLLAGVTGTAAFAGCLGQSSDASTSSTSHTTSSTETTGTTEETRTTGGTNSTTGASTTESKSGAGRLVTIPDAGAFETGSVTGSLSVRTSRITDAHTAELVLSLGNRSSKSVELSYTQSRGLDLITGTRSSGDARLLLVGGDVAWTRTDDCWQPDARVLARGIPDRKRSVTVPKRGAWTETYQLWNHPENQSCLPPGTYEFARVFQRNDDQSTWRFTISLSRAD